MSHPLVCLYHAQCLDGTAAAWVVNQRHPDALLIPVQYHKPIPPECEGAEVILVDFCYKQYEMQMLIDMAHSVHVIDHHEPTGLILAPLLNYASERDTGFYADFNESMSGALLAYHVLFPTLAAAGQIPALIRHISDRDLYEFRLPHTRGLVNAIGVAGYDPMAWREQFASMYDLVERRIDDTAFYAHYRPAAIALEAYVEEQTRRAAELSCRMVVMFDKVVPLLNVPRAMASDALALYTDDHPYAVAYYDTDEHRVFSIRSKKNGTVRVNDLAKTMGGGGHPSAAGFVVPRDHELARL